MSDMAAQKAAARALASAARKSAHAAYSGADAAQNLLAFLKPHLGKPMSGYMPIQSEIDPLAAMAELCKSGPVGVPVITGDRQPLEFHRWHPDAAMTDGPFGASVPAVSEALVPSIIILPLLAFDTRGHRLGYGGGYYDRTLQSLRNRGPVLAVGFAYSAQETDSVPVAITDQPMDAILTENGARLF